MRNVKMSNYQRCYYIDWLRVLAILTIFIFHCARFFNHEDWHVKNSQLSLSMSILVGFLVQWIMPTFLILSGFSAYYSLSYQTSGGYITAKLKRLMVPLIFGMFTHIPLQVYFERTTHSQFSGSFFQFYPRYFDGFYGFGGNFAWMGMHLWYLLVLFVFSTIMLPVFLYIRKKNGFISRLANLFKKPWAIILPVFPLAIVEMLVSLQPEGIGRRDFGGWSLPAYLVLFIYGYLIASHPQFRLTIERCRITSLVFGITASALMIFSWLFPTYFNSLDKSAGWFIRAFNVWFWLVAIIGFGSRYLDFNNRVLKYANDAVLPFYILHQTVILTIGLYVVRWDANVMLKYLVIIASSFSVIFLLYELLIRRLNLLRFLFGMKMQSSKNHIKDNSVLVKAS